MAQLSTPTWTGAGASVIGVALTFDQPQHGGTARRHAQVLQEPRPGSTAAHDADPPLRFGQLPRTPCARPEEIGHLLSEGAPGSAGVEPVEASNLDAQHRLRDGDRQIGRVAVIAAVDGSARLAARGMPADLSARMDINREVIRALLDAATDTALGNDKRERYASDDGKLSLSRHRPESIRRYPRKVSKNHRTGATSFDAWGTTAKACGAPAIVIFAPGLDGDGAAVRAALTEPRSSGQVEGQISRLKLIKRRMVWPHIHAKWQEP